MTKNNMTYSELITIATGISDYSCPDNNDECNGSDDSDCCIECWYNYLKTFITLIGE